LKLLDRSNASGEDGFERQLSDQWKERVTDFSDGLTRRTLVRQAAAGGASLSALGFLAACGGGGRTSTVLNKQAKASDAEVAEVTWALPAAPRSLDYVTAYDDPNAHCLAPCLGGLLRFDSQGVVQPNLAESWNQPDQRTYEFKLRPGVKFSDGTPVTAEDAAFSMSRVMDPKSGSGLVGFFINVDRISAPDDQTVRVAMKRPDPLWINMAAHPGGFVVKKQFTVDHPKDAGTPDALPIGAGPYKVTRYVPNDRVVLERNPFYWGPKPKVRRAVLRFIPDNATRLLALRSGEIDGAFEVPVEDGREWRKIEGASIVAGPGVQLCYMSFNVEVKPFDDPHVRRAFAYAYDATSVVDRLLDGLARVPPRGALPMPELWANLGLSTSEVSERYAQSLPDYSFNLDKAKQEIAASRYRGGIRVKVTYPDSFARVGQALLTLKANLSKIGVALDVRQTTFDKWIADVSEHSIPFICGVGFADFPDPMDILYYSYDSKFAVPNAYNTANYKNPALDRLCDAYLRSGDKKQRADDAFGALQLAQRDLPLYCMWWENVVMAVRDKFVFQDPNPWYFLQAWPEHIAAAA
jgi:peptide/nickel transport system substrate-binding protein